MTPDKSVVSPVVSALFAQIQPRFAEGYLRGLALNLWTVDLMGIIPGGGSDVQTKKKNIYERAEG
jgi:hypothetical protein